MPVDSFGRRVRLLREDMGLTQGELRDEMERLTGVSIGGSYLSQLERGKSSGKMPSLEVAVGLARTLGCSLDYLAQLSDDPASSKQAPQDSSYLSEEADLIAEIVDKLSPPARIVILQTVRIAAEAERTGLSRRLEEFKMLLQLVEAIAGGEVRRRVEAELRRAGGTFSRLGTESLDHTPQFS